MDLKKKFYKMRIYNFITGKVISCWTISFTNLLIKTEKIIIKLKIEIIIILKA